MNNVVIFTKRYCCDSFVSAPIAELKNPVLGKAWHRFKRLFPDHPSGENTVLYLLEIKSNEWNLLWTCSHFECTYMDNIKEMGDFLEQLSSFCAEDYCASLDLLDAFAEKLMILVPNVDKDIFY